MQSVNINNDIYQYTNKKKNLKSGITLTAKVSMLFTWWNVHYAIKNTSEKQKLRLALNWTIIEKIQKKPKRNTSSYTFPTTRDILRESLREA